MDFLKNYYETRYGTNGAEYEKHKKELEEEMSRAQQISAVSQVGTVGFLDSNETNKQKEAFDAYFKANSGLTVAYENTKT